jgi:hypothetical protein
MDEFEEFKFIVRIPIGDLLTVPVAKILVTPWLPTKFLLFTEKENTKG